MKKIEGNSLDLIKNNIEKLKELFPNIVTDGKIDFEILKLILGEELEVTNERYDFSWNGKINAIKNSQTPSTSTLRPAIEKSVKWDATNNLYIEGDNLEALKLLQKTYYGKIKMIYIDPPYNTGNDFVYNDDFIEPMENYLKATSQQNKANPNTSGRFHTDWLNMMLPRIILARNLLSEDGSIFISIDDNELTRLKMIMDLVFGENCFCAQISVKSNPGGRDYGGFAVVHDYMLVYTKTAGAELNMLEDKDKEFPFKDSKGGFSLMELRNRNIKFNNFNRPNLYYPFYINPNNVDENGLYEIDLVPHDDWIELYPQESQGVKTVWRWGKGKSSKYLNEEIKGKAKQDGGYQIVQKYRSNLKRERTIWDDTNYRNEAGSLELKSLFDGKKPFDYPKSVSLLENAILIGSDEDSIILDFFSGSATTAQAVLNINAKYGSNRKFILVQLPEMFLENSDGYKMGFKTICDAGEERIKKSIDKCNRFLLEKIENVGLFSDEMIQPESLDLGFKVFKLDSSNIKPWDGLKKLDQVTIFDLDETIKEDRTNLDVAYEIMLKYGIFNMPLKEVQINNKTMYNIGEGYMIICLDNDINSKDVMEIANLKPHCVVFKEQGFADDNEKINATYTLERLGVEDVKCI